MDRSGFQYVTENPEKDLRLQILVCGKTGSGKSALINSVIGHEVCATGGPGSKDIEDGEYFERVTKNVNAVHCKVNGIIVTVWDSPGLQDATHMDKVYVQDMYDKCKDVDLVYYCIEMTTVRWGDRDIDAIKLMAQKFDFSFWNKCILVLTKANSVHVSLEYRKDKNKYFEQLYNNFKKKFQEELNANYVPTKVSEEIPATCAGIIDDEYEGPGTQSHKDRYLHYTSNYGDYSDGKPKHFLPELWLISLQRLPINSRLKYMRVTGNEERFPKDVLPIIEKICESEEDDDVKANQTSESQNTSEDRIENEKKSEKDDEVKANQTSESQNTSEERIENEKKSEKDDEVKANKTSESQNTSVENAEEKSEKDDEVKANKTSESQNTTSVENAEKKSEEDDEVKASESQKIIEDRIKAAEKKIETFYKQYQDVPVAPPMKGTDLPMDKSQKNRLKKVSIRKNTRWGAFIGGIAGSIVPIAGNIVGAAVGAGVGAAIAKAKRKKASKTK